MPQRTQYDQEKTGKSGGFGFGPGAAGALLSMAGQPHQFAAGAGGAQFGPFEQGAIATDEVEFIKPFGPAGFDGIYEVKVLQAIHDTSRVERENASVTKSRDSCSSRADWKYQAAMPASRQHYRYRQSTHGGSQANRPTNERVREVSTESVISRAGCWPPWRFP
ncbi:hypothetical protein GJ700_30405 [Duganella sp. FT92W]|uniref:Uncharacterized protein n=1 Tax=Pseudoduganella rivuli TaxID=2666085 RepID=A0A7X2LUU6_9BURK|nr:hypothetical protein [Pseudoduganella rivuli]MRV76035.1 hypothetical protein [Pseudoduganella rivuli]